jgi:hypothetical protein
MTILVCETRVELSPAGSHEKVSGSLHQSVKGGTSDWNWPPYMLGFMPLHDDCGMVQAVRSVDLFLEKDSVDLSC